MKAVFKIVIVLLLAVSGTFFIPVEPAQAQAEDSVMLYLKRAALAMNSRQWDRARLEYMRVIHLDSSNVEALRNMGFIASVKGDQKTARFYLELALRFGPKDPEVHNNLGVVCEEEKKYDQAVRFFRKASELAPEKASYLVHLGNTYALAGRPKEGLPYLEQAMQKDTSDWQIPYYVGTSFSAVDQFDSAETYFLKSVERGGHSAKLYYFLGVAQRNQGKIEKCVKSFRAALEKSPDYIECRQALGIVYSMTGRFKDAISQFEHIVLSDSTYYPGLVSLGVAYALDRQFARADTVLYRLNKIDTTLGNRMTRMIKSQVDRFKKLREEQE